MGEPELEVMGRIIWSKYMKRRVAQVKEHQRDGKVAVFVEVQEGHPLYEQMRDGLVKVVLRRVDV